MQKHRDRGDILEPTYRALVKDRYADITIQRIGETFEKSPSLVYHHFENKDEVVLACLEYMLDRFGEIQTKAQMEDPHQRFEEIVEWTYGTINFPEERDFIGLLIDLRTVACNDPAFADHFTRSDALFVSHLTHVIERGNDSDVFACADPATSAEALFTYLLGVMVRGSTQTDQEAVAVTRDEIDWYIEQRILSH